MDKYIYNEKNGLWYELQGDYDLPCLKLPEERTAYIGVWGQRHLRYLKQYHRVRYYILLTSGKLNSYLADIDRQAEEMFPRRVKELAEKEGVTEAIKSAIKNYYDRNGIEYDHSRFPDDCGEVESCRMV